MIDYLFSWCLGSLFYSVCSHHPDSLHRTSLLCNFLFDFIKLFVFVTHALTIYHTRLWLMLLLLLLLPLLLWPKGIRPHNLTLSIICLFFVLVFLFLHIYVSHCTQVRRLDFGLPFLTFQQLKCAISSEILVIAEGATTAETPPIPTPIASKILNTAIHSIYLIKYTHKSCVRITLHIYN